MASHGGETTLSACSSPRRQGGEDMIIIYLYHLGPGICRLSHSTAFLCTGLPDAIGLEFTDSSRSFVFRGGSVHLCSPAQQSI